MVHLRLLFSLLALRADLVGLLAVVVGMGHPACHPDDRTTATCDRPHRSRSDGADHRLLLFYRPDDMQDVPFPPPRPAVPPDRPARPAGKTEGASAPFKASGEVAIRVGGDSRAWNFAVSAAEM